MTAMSAIKRFVFRKDGFFFTNREKRRKKRILKTRDESCDDKCQEKELIVECKAKN